MVAPLAKMKGSLRINSPQFQNFIMGCMLFCLPGIYGAITGLGAGGGKSSSQVTSSDANSILYGAFTLFGWLGGSILNVLGPRTTAVFGAIGYPLYVGGLWYFDRTSHNWFVLFAGAMLGVTAGCLWTATGYVSYVYPQEHEKGTYIVVQYMLHSLGSAVAAAIALGVNIHETKTKGVATGVYIAFIIIMSSSIIIGGLFIVNPKKVVRNDGTHIAIFKRAAVKVEAIEMLKVFIDPRILLLTPAIFIGEFAVAIVSSVNGFYFNLRTRCLNNFIYQILQIVNPYILSFILDCKYVKRRRTRGFMGIAFIGTITLCTCAGMAAFIEEDDINQRTTKARGYDWTSPGYYKYTLIYFFFALLYSGLQIVIEWILAALTNDPATLARYSGMFKGTGSLGICVAFILDSQKVAYIWQLTVQFIIYFIGLAGMTIVVWYYVTDTNYFTEELVIVPHKVEEEAKIEGLVTEEQIAHELEKERKAAEVAQNTAEITP